MKRENNLIRHSRRDFLKQVSLIGGAAYLGFGGIFSIAKPLKSSNKLINEFEYQYRTISVKHIKEVGEWFRKLDSEGKLGSNATFKKYIGAFNFNPQEILPGAKSLILISIPMGMQSITFRRAGKNYDILIPSGYWDDGVTYEGTEARIRDDLMLDASVNMEPRVKLPLKTLSVRSGLADYGKNNITFVREYGSFHQLIAFYTDIEMEDSWRPINMLRLCKGCDICKDKCPTKCIRDENFVINVDKCVTLYNELEDPMPEWMPAEAHNAFVGCIHCQYTCPANAEGIKNIGKIADVNEEETEYLLSDRTDEKMQKHLSEKLKLFPYINYPDYFRRNFRLVMANTKPV
ncbi:MAG: twin-arginine translocation signal domain-containing protein [Bacteroidetes bacterium]|nr:twin-arginine translocation signal domain-containing protein [Bacteroidota bacterium]